ncbi:MAG: hypothetical protein ACLQG3_04175 [Terracidiphilus sp.]
MKSTFRSPRFFGISLWFLSLPLLLPVAAPSQQFTRDELAVSIGLQTVGQQTCVPIGAGPQCQPETNHYAYPSLPSFTYSRNLSPSLALEGMVQPTSFFLETNSLGSGRQMLALGGVRAGWRGQRWGLYGKVRAGVAGFSCGTFDYDPSAYSDCTRQTNFAMEYGGVAEYRLRPRWALRVDAAHLMILQFDQVLARYSNGLPMEYRGGATLQHFDARVGITRSFGRLEENTPERVPDKQAWDFGALFALQPRIFPDFQYLNAYPTWGVWGSWNFSRHVSWDSVVMHSGRNSGFTEWIDYQAGGRAFEALTGVKLGIRRDHMGYFGELRGGTITFGETEKQIVETAPGVPNFNRGMFTNPVLNAGGVLEVYPSRHTILRFDTGSATIFYLPKNTKEILLNSSTTFSIPSEQQTTILMSFGAGFRF